MKIEIDISIKRNGDFEKKVTGIEVKETQI
jgi:hypothetical protein